VSPAGSGARLAASSRRVRSSSPAVSPLASYCRGGSPGPLLARACCSARTVASSCWTRARIGALVSRALRQRQLAGVPAARLGYDRSVIAKAETGERPPTPEVAVQVLT